MVRNALNSIKNIRYDNWHLAFIDDGSVSPGRPIVEEILCDKLDHVSFHQTNATFEDKLKSYGVGHLIAKILGSAESDLVVSLDDDDAFHPDYFEKLNWYFKNNQDVLYCYSNVYFYNPLIESPEGEREIKGFINFYKKPINCAGKVDISQVAYRRKVFAEAKVTKNVTIDLDSHVFDAIFRSYGPAEFTGFVSQYKGIHGLQLTQYKERLAKNPDWLQKFGELQNFPGARWIKSENPYLSEVLCEHHKKLMEEDRYVSSQNRNLPSSG